MVTNVNTFIRCVYSFNEQREYPHQHVGEKTGRQKTPLKLSAPVKSKQQPTAHIHKYTCTQCKKCGTWNAIPKSLRFARRNEKESMKIKQTETSFCADKQQNQTVPPAKKTAYSRSVRTKKNREKRAQLLCVQNSDENETHKIKLQRNLHKK